MKKFNRIISMILAVFMIMSACSALATIQVFAADETSDDNNTAETPETPETPVGSTIISTDPETDPYINNIYATPEEKIATMRLAIKKNGFELYVDDYSGEVACVNTITGEKLFTNPYDVGASTGNATTKYEILSQIIVNFTDNAQGGQFKTFTSYQEAAHRGQIITENIKDGIRVEYTIGREQSKTLVPRWISQERFEEMILSKFEEAFPDGKLYEKADSSALLDVQAFLTRYTLYSLDKIDMSAEKRNAFGYVSDNLNASDRDKARVIKDYPIVSKMAVFVFDATASEAEIAECEEIILKYCPEYTYEELEWDHAITDYESEDENPPVFRLALEYKIEEDGLSVRLPANGIRFNESLYTLESIDVLPYMGAGHSGYEGYNFFPDGSGTLFDFKELNTSTSRSIVGKVYGTDFAYHEISGTYQKPIRYPVFGIVEEYSYYNYTVSDIDTGKVISSNNISGAIVDTIRAYEKGESGSVCKGNESKLYAAYNYIMNNVEAVETKVTDKRGYVAIIEEGDALASLSTYHAGSLSDYNTIKMSVVPRPKDTYNLQDSISVGSGGDFSIVCDRKYVGSYKMKYILLSDTDREDLALPEEMKNVDYKTYDTSWMGMAVAYREYLTDESVGVLTKLTKDDIIENNIPLYIETFGAVETTKKILSIPVNMMESLTTFEDIVEMYEHLSGQGIKNINFKLTGYANGGMYYSVPGKLEFEKVVGGNDGFQELLDKAADINSEDGSNLGIFPDFDIVYQLNDGWFDGYSQFDHAAKTIDDRYATRREYSTTQQKYMNYYEIIISPAYFDILYNRIEKNYAKKYDNVVGISVSTLGQWLNSDFDEDDPYNREDSKQFTIEAFEHFDANYAEVMTDGGNAYVWKYADHMLNVSLDSSRYIFSANAVPFIGVVLHGSVSFAGEPLNMEGDMQYAILKAIENGASPYFILSMDNTNALKDYFDLSQYYSIRYDIWKDDIAGVYSTLNGVLGDVQDKYIIGHEFLSGGVRIPDSDELESDILNELLKDIENEDNAAEILWLETKLEASNARKNGKLAEAHAAEAVAAVLAAYINHNKAINSAVGFDRDYFDRAKEAYIIYYRAVESGDQDAITKAEGIKNAVTVFNRPASEYEEMNDYMDGVIAQYTRELEAAVGAYYERNGMTGDIQLDYGKATIVYNHQLYYNAKSSLKSAYAALGSATTDDDKAAAQAKIDEIEANIQTYLAVINDAELYELAKLYFKVESAKYGKQQAIVSKYNIDFDSYVAAQAVSSEATSFYSLYKNLVKNDAADDMILGWYASYVENDKIAKELDAEVKTYSKMKNAGYVDNYVEAWAKASALKELGYDVSDDAAKKEQYTMACDMANSVRLLAVQSVATLQSADYRTIVNYYESTKTYMAIATAAIEVLAKSEGVEVKYAEGSEKTVRDIVNYDEIALKSGIVKQAIDRAIYVADCVELDRYELIVEGRETNITINGHKVRSARGSDGKDYYFYGTAESGYSYFTIGTNGEVGVYILPNSSKMSVKIGDLVLYQVAGQSLYFTASVEGGYTYYEYNQYYEKYVPKAATVYSGEKVAELSDGTEIFYDGDADVYYSVNADGTYSRYTYTKSLTEYMSLTVAATEETKQLAFDMVAKCSEFDSTFSEDVQRRIDRDNAPKEEPEEEKDTSSRYDTENIVAVTYGDDNNNPYKTVILNYNNYTVNIVYDGIEYTIPAYEFVAIMVGNKK